MDTNEFEHNLRQMDALRSEESDDQIWFHPKDRNKDYFHVEIERGGRHKGTFELTVYAEESFSVISSPRRNKFNDELNFAQFVVKVIIEEVSKPKELDYYQSLFLDNGSGPKNKK